MGLVKLLMDQYGLDEWVANELANASPERLKDLVAAIDRPPVPPPLATNQKIKISDSIIEDDEGKSEQADIP